jgi:hypothetical protein
MTQRKELDSLIVRSQARLGRGTRFRWRGAYYLTRHIEERSNRKSDYHCLGTKKYVDKMNVPAIRVTSLPSISVTARHRFPRHTFPN